MTDVDGNSENPSDTVSVFNGPAPVIRVLPTEEGEIIPLQERIETAGDDSDLREVYDTERHLLCVACTRARDQLLVTSAGPASEFLDDLAQGAGDCPVNAGLHRPDGR